MVDEWYVHTCHDSNTVSTLLSAKIMSDMEPVKENLFESSPAWSEFWHFLVSRDAKQAVVQTDFNDTKAQLLFCAVGISKPERKIMKTQIVSRFPTRKLLSYNRNIYSSGL